MTFTEHTGSLFESQAQGYAHGINIEGLMGAGIAVAFKRAYPEMYKRYREVCALGDIKPGDVWVWDVVGNGFFEGEGGDINELLLGRRFIYNIASQDLPGPHARLEWFEEGFTAMLEHAEFHNISSVALPRIGCGIGGLDWADVRDIIDHYAGKTPIDIEVWTP